MDSSYVTQFDSTSCMLHALGYCLNGKGYAGEAGDLAKLCHHADAGTLVISGWRMRKPGTFPREFGAHAGPGPEETNGFADLPSGALTVSKDLAYVRNEDLRKAAQRILARAS